MRELTFQGMVPLRGASEAENVCETKFFHEALNFMAWSTSIHVGGQTPSLREPDERLGSQWH